MTANERFLKQGTLYMYWNSPLVAPGAFIINQLSSCGRSATRLRPDPGIARQAAYKVKQNQLVSTTDPVRHMSEHRQSQLEYLVQTLSSFLPRSLSANFDRLPLKSSGVSFHKQVQ